MKSAQRIPASASRRLLSFATFAATLPLAHVTHAAPFTWDGGGADGKTSTAANWNPDGAPGATGNNLIFAGTANLTVNNDSITSLVSNSFNFASGAGSFNIGGNALTVGNGASNDNIITKVSTNDQTISANLTLAGGGRDRTIIMTGGGNLTLSGNINFSNDWLFPTTTAGTIVISGNNSGDGKGAAITSGTNTMRAALRNNVDGTRLALGSDTALGNSGSGDAGAGAANFKGIVNNTGNLNISTTGGDRNLSGSSLGLTGGARITFDGAGNLTIGNLLNGDANKDFWVTNTGQVTVSNGLFLSSSQTGRALYLNLSGTGGMVVDGKLYNTFHSGGVTTNATDSSSTSTTAILRKAGTGTLTLNGDSGTTYTGTVQVEAGTLKIGHANALGNAAGATIISSGATLDLNGQTTGETLKINTGTGVGGNGALVNSNTSASASLTADIVNPGSFTIGGAGDINATRIRSVGVFTITKVGAGTLTTGGNSHNNLAVWDVQNGTVVLANTSGFGADRGVTLNGGTLKLSGANSNLVNDSQAFTINSGTFDLNGKAEAVASIGGSGGTITNTNATAATLFVGGGVSGNSTATYGGVIQNGAGVLALTKEGTGTQTLSGNNTYSGATTVSNGTLEVTGSLLSSSIVLNGGTFKLGTGGSISSSSTITINGGSFDSTALVGGYTVASGQTLKGNGTYSGKIIVGTGATLAPGNSPGVVTFDNDLTLAGTTVMEINGSVRGTDYDGVNLTGSSANTLTYGGTLSLSFGAAIVAGTYDLFALGSVAQTGDFASVGANGDGIVSSFSGLSIATGTGWTANLTDTLSQSWILTFSNTTGDLTIATAIPEPSTYAILAGFGAISLALYRRRRVATAA